MIRCIEIMQLTNIVSIILLVGVTLHHYSVHILISILSVTSKEKRSEVMECLNVSSISIL